MTSVDWVIVGAAFVALVLGVSFLWVGTLRTVRVNGWGNGHLFRRPAAPWTLYGLAVLLAGALGMIAWALVPTYS